MLTDHQTLHGPDSERQALWLLLLVGLVILGAGMGLRDPWPADEPRFALVAKQMVESGQWLFPFRGGEIYPIGGLSERNRELETLVGERTAALKIANDQLEALSNTDGLTGIANRRSFDSALAQEWKRAQRAGNALALL